MHAASMCRPATSLDWLFALAAHKCHTATSLDWLFALAAHKCHTATSLDWRFALAAHKGRPATSLDWLFALAAHKCHTAKRPSHAQPEHVPALFVMHPLLLIAVMPHACACQQVSYQHTCHQCMPPEPPKYPNLSRWPPLPPSLPLPSSTGHAHAYTHTYTPQTTGRAHPGKVYCEKPPLILNLTPQLVRLCLCQLAHPSSVRPHSCAHSVPLLLHRQAQVLQDCASTRPVSAKPHSFTARPRFCRTLLLPDFRSAFSRLCQPPLLHDPTAPPATSLSAPGRPSSLAVACPPAPP